MFPGSDLWLAATPVPMGGKCRTDRLFTPFRPVLLLLRLHPDSMALCKDWKGDGAETPQPTPIDLPRYAIRHATPWYSWYSF